MTELDYQRKKNDIARDAAVLEAKKRLSDALKRSEEVGPDEAVMALWSAAHSAWYNLETYRKP